MKPSWGVVVACCLSIGCGQAITPSAPPTQAKATNATPPAVPSFASEPTTETDLFDEIAIRALDGGQAGLHKLARDDTHDEFLPWLEAAKWIDSVNASSDYQKNLERVAKNDIDELISKGDAVVRRRMDFVFAELAKRHYPKSMLSFTQLQIYKIALDHIENPHLHK